MRVDINGAIVPNEDAEFYEVFGLDYCCPGQIKQRIAENTDGVLDVFINSGGGSVFDGAEIYSELRSFPGPVYIHVTGLAASAASVIACAGPSDISPAGMLMIHNCSGSAFGDYHDMAKSAEILQKVNCAIAEAYAEKTGKDGMELLKLMDRETWMTAAEAVENGFIDAVAAPKNTGFRPAAALGGGLIPQAVLDKLRTDKVNASRKSDVLINKAKAELKLLSMKGSRT